MGHNSAGLNLYGDQAHWRKWNIPFLQNNRIHIIIVMALEPHWTVTFFQVLSYM